MSRSTFHIVTVSLFLAGGWLLTVGASHALDMPEDIVNGKALYDKACLLCHGEEKHLEPKAFELLDLLLARRPEAVSIT